MRSSAQPRWAPSSLSTGAAEWRLLHKQQFGVVESSVRFCSASNIDMEDLKAVYVHVCCVWLIYVLLLEAR